MKDLAERPPVSDVVSADDLERELLRLGVEAGDTILVHCALSAFGYLIGGEQAVLDALRRVLGPSGTIVMPAQSWQLCDPDYLDDPRLGPEARALVRRHLPAFDPVLTPSRSMGRVAELFRCQREAIRSTHPHRSFAASGPAAEALMREHAWDDPFGECSPLAKLYADRAKIVLLGVGYGSCTALHLAETRAAEVGRRPLVANGAPVRVDGARTWMEWLEPAVDDRRFQDVGEEFEALGSVRSAYVGAARCRVMDLVALVDFAQVRLS